MRTVNIHEAKTHLSRLVEAAAKGEAFIIAKAGKPLVKVVPIEEQPAERNKTAWLYARYRSTRGFRHHVRGRDRRDVLRREVRLLLDTHLLLWAAGPSPRLSSGARRLIDDPSNELLFSAASLWEIAIKSALRRPSFRLDPSLFQHNLLNNNYQELVVTGEHAAAVASLPLLHRDPFERMLVAQSIVEGVVLLTADPVVAQYPAPVRKV